MHRFLFLFSLIILTTNSAQAEGPKSPYAGWQQRSIKALSTQQIEGYRTGKGMSLALAAELNGYPGPRHTLDLGKELDLDANQIAKLETLFVEMKKEASTLGEQLIALETRLDRMFANGHINESTLQAVTAEIGTAQGKLRFTHLKYHLITKALLRAEQIAAYEKLRGYDGNGTGKHRHGH